MTDKPIKSIRLTRSQWKVIELDISKTRPQSWLIIRSSMRSKLGFLTRTHQEWDPKNRELNKFTILDFYDEQKKTLFVLKYGPFDKLENN